MLLRLEKPKCYVYLVARQWHTCEVIDGLAEGYSRSFHKKSLNEILKTNNRIQCGIPSIENIK